MVLIGGIAEGKVWDLFAAELEHLKNAADAVADGVTGSLDQQYGRQLMRSWMPLSRSLRRTAE